MKILYDIVRKLRKAEIRRLKQRMQQAPFDYERVGTLFDLVTRYEEREEAFYSQKLYSKAPDNTFRVTKSRLKRLLENLVLHDKSLTGYSPAVNARLQARKRHLQGEILLGRGAYAASKTLLLQALAQAKKYHLYEEEFQTELLLYRNYHNRSSVKDFEKHTQHILELNRKRYLLTQGTILYYRLSNQFGQQTLSEDELQAMQPLIAELGHIAEETQHPSILGYWLLSDMYHKQLSGQDAEALDCGQRYLRLVRETPELHSQQREAVAEGYLGEILLRLGRFTAARAASDRSLAGFEPDEMNYLRGLELAFRIAFFSGELSRARSLIAQALQHPILRQGDEFDGDPLLRARWAFFAASVAMREGKVSEASQFLPETTPLFSDKKGWNLQVRRLEIMIQYELGHLDLLETKIMNLQQFMKRSQTAQREDRSGLLLKLLLIWAKQQFDVSRALDQGQAVLEALQRSTTSPFGGEADLISLEQWMQQKAAEEAANS